LVGVVSIIIAPGAYADISNEAYHRDPNLLPGPSLSSTGAKMLLAQSPFHFWHASALNPDRLPESDKRHLNVGKAAHDLLLLQDRWPDAYHVTPEGFSRAAKKAQADDIAEAEHAAARGLTILSHDDDTTVRAVAAALRGNPLAMRLLSDGVAEETLAWQDGETGVWLRARPDFRTTSCASGGAIRIDADLKFMAATHCSPVGFSRAIDSFGYHQSAAFYADGIKAVYGQAPTHRVHVVVEKDAPHSVSLYQLPAEDLDYGRALNRRAIRLFADCQAADRWPAWADSEFREVGLPVWARKRIDAEIEAET
jgi:hypothetical protein